VWSNGRVCVAVQEERTVLCLSVRRYKSGVGFRSPLWAKEQLYSW